MVFFLDQNTKTNTYNSWQQKISLYCRKPIISNQIKRGKGYTNCNADYSKDMKLNRFLNVWINWQYQNMEKLV